MKYCVIDIGSNSVRLMLSENGNTIYKKVKITRLAENLGKERFLCPKAIERTALAVCNLYNEALLEKPDSIYVFATAAVRESFNGGEFCDKLKKLTGLTVDVVSGEVEASIGVRGALKGERCGMIDIGGASTEVAYIGENTSYSKSYKIGAGTLTERMKSEALSDVLNDVFENLPKDLGKNFVAIGGTAISVATMLLELKVYKPELVDGFFIEKKKLFFLRDRLSIMSIEEISRMPGLQKGREEVIFAGVSILCYLVESLALDGVRVSESDNLEGYLDYIRGKNEKKI